MKKFFKISPVCCHGSDDDIQFSVHAAMMTTRTAVIPNYLKKIKDIRLSLISFTKNTVIVTYTGLADQTEALVEKLKALKADKTDDNVKSVCETFLNARAWWEKSEAFLFGAASDFGIDPHIDSWPLDLDGLLDEMKNTSHITAMEAEDADVWAGVKLGPELLGFHGIEYIIFEAGSPKAVSKIKDKELTYAIAVAGDLRNKMLSIADIMGRCRQCGRKPCNQSSRRTGMEYDCGRR